MFLRTHRPGPPLSMHVEHLWELQDAPRHATERVLPTGTLELVFNLAHDAVHVQTCNGDQRLTGAIVSGVYQRYFAIDTKDHADMVGVHFKPGGAWGVLGVAPGELTERHVDLEDLWGRSYVRQLRELLLATAKRRRLTVLEAELAARCASSRELHAACLPARAALARGARVTDVAAELGLSARRLQAVFQEQVGTTPKLFARICRFQRVLRGLPGAPNWPELAIDAGYFDQSHLVREFHLLAGCAPTELTRAQQVTVKQHHLALPRGSDLSNT